MQTDVAWWIKLWWHGVDIAANVIVAVLSAAVVWLAGFLFLRRKHQMEIALEKQKERVRIAAQQEAANERVAHAAKQRLEAFEAEREQFAIGAQTISNRGDLQPFVTELNNWLFRQGFHHAEPNDSLMKQWQTDDWQRLVETKDFAPKFANAIRTLKMQGK
jgi:Tfp pilus assembly protein PilO